MTQSKRKLVGVFLVVGGLTLYCLIAAGLLSALPRLNIVLEVILYTFFGIVWIFPMRSVMVWMETGSWWVRRDH